MNLSSFSVLLPLIVVVPIFVALILFFVKNYTLSWLITLFTTIVLFLTAFFLLLISGLNPMVYYFGNFMPPYGIEYKLDSLNIFFIIIVSFIAIITTLWSKASLLNEIGQSRARYFNSVFLLSLSGALGILITNDLFNLFVFLEVSALTTYILIAMTQNKKSALAAFNYLVVGTVSASFYVFGVGILYLLFGTLNAEDLIHKIYTYPNTPMLMLAIAMITIGIVIKIALVPVAFWLPSAYKTAPTAVAAFLSGTATKVAIYMFLKVVITVIGRDANVNLSVILNIILIMAIVSMFVGGIIAVKQYDLKLLLAFSSISQMGFIMLGFAMFNVEGISAGFFSILSHSLIKTGLFLCVGNLLYVFGSDSLKSLAGMGHKAPFSFFAIIFLSLSLAGIPGTSAFWGKLYLLISAFRSEFWYVGFFVIVASLLSFYYAWKIIYTLWLKDDGALKPIKHTIKIPLYMNISIAILIFLNIALTIYPGVIYFFAEQIISLSIVARG
jgi:multicomponent Na+:H+ antiporter subunit D